jgi:hypothetical protein
MFKATRIMQQMRSGPKQLRALAEELGARQEAKCQKREIDLRHDPSLRLSSSVGNLIIVDGSA